MRHQHFLAEMCVYRYLIELRRSQSIGRADGGGLSIDTDSNCSPTFYKGVFVVQLQCSDAVGRRAKSRTDGKIRQYVLGRTGIGTSVRIELWCRIPVGELLETPREGCYCAQFTTTLSTIK